MKVRYMFCRTFSLYLLEDLSYGKSTSPSMLSAIKVGACGPPLLSDQDSKL